MATISNTPRPGYVWDSTDNVWYPIGVGNHNHGEIAKTIVDAKGDLIVATAADTVDRLPVGADGTTLVANSASATGLAYAGPSYIAGKNLIINGGYDIWQRGTSFTTSGAYTADRWAEVNGTNSITYTRSTDVPSNLGFQYSISRAGTGSNMNQRIEAANAALFAGQTVTLSFYYKSTTGADLLGFSIYNANSADNFAGLTQIGSNQTITTPSTSWTRVTYSFAVPAGGANGLSLYFFRGNTSTSTTLFTGVQLELGSVATAFSRAGGTLQGELAACQRYYWRATVTSGNYLSFAVGQVYNTTQASIPIPNPVQMRTGASSVEYSNLGITNSGATPIALTNLVLNFTGPLNNGLAATVASGVVAGNATTLGANNSSAAYVGFSAEL